MIALLLHFYPAAWRARYGDEFEWLLLERPLGPFDVADLLLGALDAQLNLRGLGAASTHGRGFPMSLRIGGYAGILAGLLWLVALVGNAINNGSETGAAWLFLVVPLATLATLVALAGMSAFQARRYPVLTWVAFAVPAAGAAVALFAMVAMTVVSNTDRPLVAGVSPWLLSMFGLIGLMVGSGLFALVTWRVRSLSRGAAALLALGAVGVVPALSGTTGGMLPTALAAPMMIGSVLAFSGGWVALGVSALRVGRPIATSLKGASL